MTENTNNLKTNILTIIIAAALGLLLMVVELIAQKTVLNCALICRLLKDATYGL